MKSQDEQRPGIHRDELITVHDLEEFKDALVSELKEIFSTMVKLRANKQWLKSFEIRKMLRVSSGKLQYMRDKGMIPFIKLGGVTYYDMEEIERLMESKNFRDQMKSA